MVFIKPTCFVSSWLYLRVSSKQHKILINLCGTYVKQSYAWPVDSVQKHTIHIHVTIYPNVVKGK